MSNYRQIRKYKLGGSGALLLAAVIAILVAVPAYGSGKDAKITAARASSSRSVASQIAALTKRPTQIGITKPVGKPIPKGKTIVDVSSVGGSFTTTVENADLKAATKALGWKLKIITPSGGTASDLLAAFAQAVTDKPSGIIYQALPQALIGRELQAAKAAHIPVVGANTGEKIGSLPGVIAQPVGPTANLPILENGAKLTALSAKSAGNAGIAFFQVSGGESVSLVDGQIKNVMKATCSSCQYYLDLINATQLATAPQIIADFLRAHPNVKAIFSTDYPQMGVGLKAALSAVGVTGVKAYMQLLTQQGLLDVRSGALAGGNFFPVEQQAYLSIDALARYFTGQSALIDNTPPAAYWFTTATAPSKWSADPVVDARQKFFALWGVK